MWNVKKDESFKTPTADGVLIETLWNVKTDGLCGKTDEDNVLIETLWNVKVLTGHSLTSTTFCINRNIVECKDY